MGAVMSNNIWNWSQRKEWIRNNTKVRKDDEYNIPVMYTQSVYTDNGPSYEQRTRFAKKKEVEGSGLLRCIDCGVYMDGGRYTTDETKQQCYRCDKESTLREIMRLMDKKGI